MLLGNLLNNCELIRSLQFRSAGTDDIETAGVAVLIDKCIVKLNIGIIQKTARAALETEKYIVLVGSLQSVIQTADNVVSAGRLTAGEDDPDNLLLGNGSVRTLYEGDLLLAVGVREQCLDLVLIRYTLRRLAFLHANVRDTVAKHSRKFRLILISCFLKRGKIHRDTPFCIVILVGSGHPQPRKAPKAHLMCILYYSVKKVKENVTKKKAPPYDIKYDPDP